MNHPAALGGPAAEAMLLESGERYRQLIEVAPVAIFLHCEGRIVLANPAMAELFRVRSVDELLGREVLDLVSPVSRELVRERIRQLYETPQKVPLAEVDYVRLDGSHFSAEVTAVSFDYAGRPAAQVVARDITDRKSAERALRASEQRFRALVELSSDWFWEQDAELRFVLTSGRTPFRGGISEFDHIGKRRWELPNTEILGQTWEDHRAVLAARASFHDLMLRRTTADGTFYIHVSGEPHYDAAGDFCGYRGVAKDITARYQIEQALREAEARLRVTLDAAPAAICLYDREERILTVNEGYARLFEQPWQEITGRTLRSTIGEEAYAFARPYIERSLAGEASTYERHRRLSDGSRRDLQIQVVPYRGAAGDVAGACAMIFDVTEIKQTQRRLEASEARFRALTELSSDFYWETDTEHRFTSMAYGNPVRGSISVETYLGRKRWEIPYAAPGEDAWRLYRESVDARRPIRAFRLARRQPSGELRHYEVDGDPMFTGAGDFLGYRGVGRDITERLRAERALQESEQRVRALLQRLTLAQEAERRRVAGDLHDLVGQNLTALGIALATLAAELAQAGHDRCEAAFDHMAQLVNETIDAVRRTMSDLHPSLLDDYGIVAALESHARQVSQRTGLAVTVESQPMKSRPSQGVELALFRIAQEALANATKHAQASRIRVSLSHGGGFLQLAVEDDGAGFSRALAQPAEHRGGWGLPLMRERAADAGGSLHIVFPGRGTRIVAKIPHVDSHHPG
jgi:PAS domain S-box-containing protein